MLGSLFENPNTFSLHVLKHFLNLQKEKTLESHALQEHRHSWDSDHCHCFLSSSNNIDKLALNSDFLLTSCCTMDSPVWEQAIWLPHSDHGFWCSQWHFHWPSELMPGFQLCWFLSGNSVHTPIWVSHLFLGVLGIDMIDMDCYLLPILRPHLRDWIIHVADCKP